MRLLEPLGGLAIEVEPFGLAHRQVGDDAEPCQVRGDGALEGDGRAVAVGIVEAQHEAAGMLEREQPVEHRRAGIADMNPPGG